MELMNVIQEPSATGSGGMIFARQGELFAKVPLGEQLSEDTNAGKCEIEHIHVKEGRLRV